METLKTGLAAIVIALWFYLIICVVFTYTPYKPVTEGCNVTPLRYEEVLP
jgi:hypothetical protein